MSPVNDEAAPCIIQNNLPQIPGDYNTIKTNDKADEQFRIYDVNDSPKRVVEHYRDMRLFQTVDFYRKMEQKYDFSNGTYRRLMTIEEAFTELENYVDSSDPDLELPNLLHLLQTAEGYVEGIWWTTSDHSRWLLSDDAEI